MTLKDKVEMYERCLKDIFNKSVEQIEEEAYEDMKPYLDPGQTTNFPFLAGWFRGSLQNKIETAMDALQRGTKKK